MVKKIYPNTQNIIQNTELAYINKNNNLYILRIINKSKTFMSVDSLKYNLNYQDMKHLMTKQVFK